MEDMGKGRSKSVTDSKLIEVGMKAEGPSFTSREVADVVGLDRDTVRVRLNELVETGVLAKKNPSSENIYWLASGWDSVMSNQSAGA